MRLQMDGTLNYGLYSHTKITPERIRNDESSYNTYKFEGLPKEAVCNVSLDAIKAAISPAKTDYLYFMRDKSTGKHIFTTNVKDHNKAVDAQRGKESKTLEFGLLASKIEKLIETCAFCILQNFLTFNPNSL